MLIKGINPQQYSAQQNMIVQTGLSNYFGNLRSYNSPKGNDVVGLSFFTFALTFEDLSPNKCNSSCPRFADLLPKKRHCVANLH